MPEIVVSYNTVTCDGPTCDKSVTFIQTQEGVAAAFQDNPWMNSIRSIQAVDQRKFVYCSDECEIKGTATGAHNKKVIVTPTGPNDTALAAQAAERARQATEAIKAGGKVTLS